MAAAAAKGSAHKPAKPTPSSQAKEPKARKPKLVRDSFSIPKDEYAVVETLKQRSAALGHPVKKSELLRAGLKLLAAQADGALRAAVQAVPSIKTGRPKADAAGQQPAPTATPTPAPAGKRGGVASAPPPKARRS